MVTVKMDSSPQRLGVEPKVSRGHFPTVHLPLPGLGLNHISASVLHFRLHGQVPGGHEGIWGLASWLCGLGQATYCLQTSVSSL